MSKLHCPLCNQAISRPYGRTPTDAPPKTLGEAIADLLEDVKAFAEGDVIADDGTVLRPEDLVMHVAGEIAGPLMEVYRREFLRNRRGRKALANRIASERAEVGAVLAGEPVPQSSKKPGRKRQIEPAATTVEGLRNTPEDWLEGI